MRAKGNGTKVSAHGLGAPGDGGCYKPGSPVMGLGPGTEDMVVDGRVWALGSQVPRRLGQVGAGAGQEQAVEERLGLQLRLGLRLGIREKRVG